MIEFNLKELFGSNKNGKFTVIELGSAAILSNEILSTLGASAFVEECFQFYSKESQERFLGEEFERSVSESHIKKLLGKIHGNGIVTSCQISGEFDEILTHGWIGIKVSDEIITYHFSIPFKPTSVENLRAFYLEKILEIQLGILFYSLVKKEITYFKDCAIDYCSNDETIFKILGEESFVENFYGISGKGEFLRFEDLARGSKGIILMRGSFNPIHKKHLEILEASKNKFPDYKVAFLISLNNFDKPKVSASECRERIKYIKENSNYPIFFTSSPFFKTTIHAIKKRWNMPLIFPVGSDTINRIVKFESGYNPFPNNVKFLAFKRISGTITLSKDFERSVDIINEYEDDGTSSTKIRERFKES